MLNVLREGAIGTLECGNGLEKKREIKMKGKNGLKKEKTHRVATMAWREREREREKTIEGYNGLERKKKIDRG